MSENVDVMMSYDSGVVTRYVVPAEFAAVIKWLIIEHNTYQTSKWDYAEEDLAHARQGLAEDSWFWERAVLNYTGRVRIFGVETQLGMQALLKLIASLASMPEHLLRSDMIESLPRPGVPSGEL